MIKIDEKLLDEFRQAGRCEMCWEDFPRLEPHHIFTRGMGGGSRLDVRLNLVALCRDCHDRAHAFIVVRKELLAISAERELRLLMRAPK